jgi:DNA polymerase-4
LLTIADVRDAPLSFLAQVAGNYAPQLQQFARGIDLRPVISEPEDAKSYSQQETFDENVSDAVYVTGVLRGMADALMSKLRRDGKAARTITVRVRYADFTDDTHGHSLSTGTDLETDIYPLLPALLRGAWRKARAAPAHGPSDEQYRRSCSADRTPTRRGQHTPLEATRGGAFA